jgi:ribonuclease HII
VSTCSEKAGPSFEIEAGLFREGHRIIAGADEAGRGSLAGPLSVGLVVFDASLFSAAPADALSLIQDSKKLTPQRRSDALRLIESIACVSLCEHVPADIVDRLNPNRATKYALDRLLERSQIKPDLLLMDGTFRFDFNCAYRAVKKGDSLSLSIAAASIVAKVTRDELMVSLDPSYPGYEFAVHKGYGTALHLEKIRALGPSPIHRRSYEPVKSMLPHAGS